MTTKFYRVERSWFLTESEKAYQIEYKFDEFKRTSKYTFVPVSVSKIVDHELYIPAWIVSQNNLWNLIAKHDSLEFEVECKQKSESEKAQKLINKFNQAVKIYFNDEIPERFCVVWLNDKHTQFDIQRIEMYDFLIEDGERVEIMTGLM